MNEVARITNDLANLTPIGTLNFYGVPGDISGVQQHGPWKWVENIPPGPVACSVDFLMSRRYIMATYRPMDFQGMRLVKVRIYSVNSDVPGSKHIHEWRRRTSLVQLRTHWNTLLQHMDFSKEGWTNRVVIATPSKSYSKTTHSKTTHPKTTHSKTTPSLSRCVFERWSEGASPKESQGSTIPPLMRLQKIYNSVRPPKSMVHAEVVGLVSELYPFQLESVLYMYEKESQDSYSPFPTLREVRSPNGSKFYFDTDAYVCVGSPAMFKLPRGGILAENMGFGKTLISIALVCLTKYECSTVPQDALLHHIPKTLERVPSLVALCVDSVNQNSLPWKRYRMDLPERGVSLLQEYPGQFHLQLVGSQYETQFSLRTRMPSQRHDHDDYRTLLLCTTTLIIVPDNLVAQWMAEIDKHVEPQFLNVLVVQQEVPPAQELIQHDVVFLTATFVATKDIDPIYHVYWKRVIIDEGHNAGSKASKTSSIYRQIHSERRWAVTGTPTSGLTSLHMAEENHGYVVKSTFNERDDLIKLGNLLGNFLHIEPFHTRRKYWAQSVVAPFMRSVPGAEQTVQSILNSVMVRHPVDCLQLPPLHHKVVLLEPSFHNKLSLNLFTAVLAINAVSSERKDVDYMFHPANASQLRRLVGNLQRSTVHWTGFKRSDVHNFLAICRECLHNGGYSQRDTNLLEKSAQAAQMALGNRLWEMSTSSHEMYYFLEGLSGIVGMFGEKGALSAPQMYTLQEIFYKNRFASELEIARLWRENDIKRENDKREEKRENDIKREKEREKNIKDIDETFSGSFNFDEIRRCRVMGTPSSKLSYLSSRLMENAHEGIKSLVFFEFEENAYYLTELLELMGVEHVMYATFVKPGQRAQNLVDFANHPGGLALVMDLKLASHGLTIVAATHVYFMNPVWHRAVEAQAIKRAHRIGQLRSVHVETLVLKGTLEEEIYKRRTNEEKDKYITDNEGMREYILRHEFLDVDVKESEYAPFSAETSTNRVLVQSDPDPYSLMAHKDEVVGGQRWWDVFLFTESNLARISKKTERGKLDERPRKRMRRSKDRGN